MELIFWILLALSIPVFYILGAIDFFKTILGKKKKESVSDSAINRTTFLYQAEQELTQFLTKHPKAKIYEYLTFLKSEQKKLTPQVLFTEKNEEEYAQQSSLSTTHHTEVLVPMDEKSEEEEEEEEEKEEILIDEEYQNGKNKKPDKDLWKNWYAENSINLLLYVGAFFIVASASIFVGFQWESIGQELKALLLTLLTLSFLFSGFLLFKNPKVKNAGVTFSAIGSLLIPLTGVGWYNFVLKNLEISFGLTWLITSLIALAVYISLGLYFKNKFYGYITSLALWSLSLSFVSLNNLDTKFYILASIISNFFILGFHLLVRNKNEDLKEVFAEPMEISTSLLMPATLVIGLLIALSENMFNSLEVSVSLFLASCYYYLFYSFTQKLWQLALSEILFPLFLVAIFGWQKASDYRLFFTFFILAFADLAISFTMLKNNLQKPALVSTTIATALTLISFVSLLVNDYSLWYSLLGSLLLLLFGFAASWIHQKAEFLHLSSLGLLFSIYIFFNDIVGLQDKRHLLGLIYLTLGSASFVTTWLVKDQQKGKIIVLLVLSIISVLVSFAFVVINQYALLTALITYGVLLHLASYRFKISSLMIGGNALFSLALYQIIDIFTIAPIYQPFIFSLFAIMLYATQMFFKEDEERATRFMFSGLLLSLITPIFYALQASFGDLALEKSALITSLITLGLFSFESIRTTDQKLSPVAVGIQIVVGLWLFKLLPSTDYLLMTLTILTGIGIILLSLYRCKNPYFVFTSNLFFFLTLCQIISKAEINFLYQPIIFVIFAMCLYGAKFSFTKYPEHQTNYKLSGLGLALLTPLYFFFHSAFKPEIEKMGLLSAYITLLIFGFEASRNKNEGFRYFTSALVMGVLLWQIRILHFENSQMYAIPLGIYFLLLGFSRKVKEDKSGEDFLNIIGIAILLLTSLFQSFSQNGASHALILGIEGIIFLLIGITTNNKLFRISGIAGLVLAVLSQTYSYLFSLPRWLITGMAGITFLAVAIFLLLKRKSEDQD